MRHAAPRFARLRGRRSGVSVERSSNGHLDQACSRGSTYASIGSEGLSACQALGSGIASRSLTLTLVLLTVTVACNPNRCGVGRLLAYTKPGTSVAPLFNPAR